MRFRLEFVDDTTCYVEADDFDDDGKTICLYRYVPEGADPLASTTQREISATYSCSSVLGPPRPVR